MKISVETDLKTAIDALQSLAKNQVPFATAYALTQTAKLAQEALEKATTNVFDRPTKYVQKSFRTIPATKRKLYAEVEVKGSKASAGVSRDSAGKPVKVVYHHVDGATRALKPFENLLQARGLMPKGWYTVQGKDAPTDQYGNVPSSLINRVLSQLQAHSAYNMDRNESAKSKARQFRSRTKRLQRYFVVLPNDPRSARLPPGIWERTSFGFGASIRPLFIYVQRAPRYRKRLAFNDIVQRAVDANIVEQFARGASLARDTAKAA